MKRRALLTLLSLSGIATVFGDTVKSKAFTFAGNKQAFNNGSEHESQEKIAQLEQPIEQHDLTPRVIQNSSDESSVEYTTNYSSTQNAIAAISESDKRRLIGNKVESLDQPLTLMSDIALQDAFFEGNFDENVLYGANASNITILNSTIRVSNGIALHQNKAGSFNNKTLFSTIHAQGYGFLSNHDAEDADGYILAFSDIYSKSADAVELNHPNITAKNFITIGCLLEADIGSDSPSSGFALGVARTDGHITALNHIKKSRQEAIHIEDGQQRGVILGNTGAGLNHHGVLTLAPKSSQGEADGVVIVAQHLRYDGNLKNKREKSGFIGVWDESGSLSGCTLSSNYFKKFGTGATCGDAVTLLNANVFDACDVGVSAVKGGQVFGENLCKGSLNHLARGSNKSILPRIISTESPSESVLQYFGNTTEAGSYIKGFCFPFDATHPGGEKKQTIGLLPIDINSHTIISGKMVIILEGSNFAAGVIDLIINGDEIKQTVEVKYRGAVSSLSLSIESDKLAVNLWSSKPLNTSGLVDFDGIYYRGS